jgi:hypothetical protein
MNNKLKLNCESPTEISKLAADYGYKYRYIDNNTLEIISKLNEWVCSITPNCIVWRHRNKRYDTAHYHPQRVCYDFKFIFESIRTHEQYELNRTMKKRKHWDGLFESIHNNTYNQIDKFKWTLS